ncbi:MAG: SPFH domain-containing protein [Lentisphaeria bacterium]|nr:SPFH domain-containing protein [Lentisphaeria bacterium]
MDANSEKAQNTPCGGYDSGMRALTRCLQGAFVILIGLIICVLAYYVAFSGGFRVESQQSVLVFRFGKHIATYDSGWHWFLPSPITDKVVIDTKVRKIKIDFLSAVNGLPEQEKQPILAPGADQYLITGDNNIIHEGWEIMYRISDPEKYYLKCLVPVVNAHLDRDDDVLVDVGTYAPINIGPRGPQTLLANLLRSTVVEVSADTPIDRIMYEKRSEYVHAVSKLFIEKLDALDIGITANEVIMPLVVEPGITKRAFNEVTKADQSKGIASSQASEYRTKTRQEALAQADRMESEAKTYSKRLVYDLEAEVKRFQSLREMSPADRQTALMALYAATISDVLDGVREKYVINNSGNMSPQVRIKLNEEPDMPKNVENAEN